MRGPLPSLKIQVFSRFQRTWQTRIVFCPFNLKMLGFDTGEPIAKTKDESFQVTITKLQEFPLQKPPFNELLNMLEADELLAIFKRFKLKRDQIQLLTNFYEQTDNSTIDLEGKWNLQKAFQHVEEKIMEKLKTKYRHSGSPLQPVFKGRLALGLQGASGVGKTYMAVSILCSEEFRNRKLYVFTPNPQDESLKRLKTDRPKNKTIFIDLEKLEDRPISMRDFDKSEENICLIDDVFDSLPESHPVRKNLSQLAKSILVKGRHHKKNKKQIGMSVVIIFHLPRQGRTSSAWYLELKDLVVFVKSNKASTVEWVTKKYHIPKKWLDQLFKETTGRFAHFHLHNPTYAVTSNIVELF